MKSKYNPSMHPRRATELIGQGMIDKELAEAFGIDEATLYRWEEAHSEFREAIKKAKEKPDRDVEAALFRRATGYDHEYDEVTASGEKDSKGANKVIRVVRKTVHVPPDVAACIFWLKNRMPEIWRNVIHLQTHYGEGAPKLPKNVKEEDLHNVMGNLRRLMPDLFDGHRNPSKN